MFHVISDIQEQCVDRPVVRQGVLLWEKHRVHNYAPHADQPTASRNECAHCKICTHMEMTGEDEPKEHDQNRNQIDEARGAPLTYGQKRATIVFSWLVDLRNSTRKLQSFLKSKNLRLKFSATC